MLSSVTVKDEATSNISADTPWLGIYVALLCPQNAGTFQIIYSIFSFIARYISKDIFETEQKYVQSLCEGTGE